MVRNILLSIVLVIVSGHVYGQCCSAGNPFFYGELSSLAKNNLQIVTGYKYSISDNYYSKNKPIAIDFIDQTYFNYLTMQLIYGLTNRFTVQGDLGYFLNKTETYKDPSWANSNGYGLGDANIILKYLAYSNFKKNIKVVPALGVTLPVGVFDQVVNNVKLPITVQPSSGSYKYQASIYFSKGIKNNKLNLTFFGMYEYSQLINSDNFYYKYGNQLLFSFLTAYNLSKKFSVAIELRNENKGRSKREENQIVDASGYKLLYVSPHLSYSFYNKWFIALNTDIPVYKYYNGIQLSNTFAISVRLSYTINLIKSKLNDFIIN